MRSLGAVIRGLRYLRALNVIFVVRGAMAALQEMESVYKNCRIR